MQNEMHSSPFFVYFFAYENWIPASPPLPKVSEGRGAGMTDVFLKS